MLIPKQQPLFIHPTRLISFILVLCNSNVFFSCHQICNHQDQTVLLAFSTNISTSPPLNWSSEVSCCKWEGVECDFNGRVTHLQLPSRSLKGVILISSISSLSMLTHLNLSNNFLHGSLGEDIISLKHLIILDLSVNNIVGSIPQEIGKLSHLQKLHLDDNSLNGPIPPSLMNCIHLVEIVLRFNRLNGDISTLDFSNLAQLQKLDLTDNSLTGVLPESIFSCESVIAIRVSNNNISGQISPKIVKLKSLSFLSLTGNSFTNITMTLRLLANCKNLTSLFLSSNFHGESLPVHKNFINIGEFPNLQFLFLSMCNFDDGPIPNWLSIIKSLRLLNMAGNKFTGQVPNWLGTLPKLFNLDLNNNSLYGELPLNLWRLPALMSENAQADLNSSQFELPIFFKGDVITTSLSSIRFKASFYHVISLNDNGFSGQIPEEIGGLINLQRLYLEHNRFSGHIPTSISKLHNLEKLDLSTNNLTGEIPTSLTRLSFLSEFDVSYNDLHGPIPSGGQIGSFDESFFKGNPGLCGKPLNQTCYSPPLSEGLDTNGSDDNKNWFLDGLCVGFASGFCVVLVFIGSFVWFHNSVRHQRPSLRRGKLNSDHHI